MTQEKRIDCLRCQHPMNRHGEVNFHEGARMGVWGSIFELLQNREAFDLYYCPNCGKVELFVPLED